MPIVGGLTSTKMIRDIEKSKSDSCLSPRAGLNGRVPIIAVSASLLERERQTLIDAGFDAWILKPISFSRLNELMAGIVDRKAREDDLYRRGEWEKGGWFDLPKPVTPPPLAAGKQDGGELKDHINVETQQKMKSRSVPQIHFAEAPPETSEHQDPITEQEQIQSPDPTE